MSLEPMRYKDYVWPHNPKIYEITYERKIAADKVPFGRYVFQNLGMTYRVLRGEGEFFGPDAYEEFKKLASIFYDEEPGILIHPIWMMTKAYFVSLSLKEEPTADYVSYTFEFWEYFDGYTYESERIEPEETPGGETDTGGALYYTVVRGDNLTIIARRYSMTLTELLALNPQIRNPNLINIGDIICVRRAGN